MGAVGNGIAALDGLDRLAGGHDMFGNLTPLHRRIVDELADVRHRRTGRLGADLHADEEYGACYEGGGARHLHDFIQSMPPSVLAYCSSVTCSIHSTVFPSRASATAICDIPYSGDAPCQCFTPGGIQTTSPGPIS